MDARIDAAAGSPAAALPLVIARAAVLWGRLRESLWFLPFVLTTTGAVLAILLTEAERVGRGLPDSVVAFLYSGGAAGARGVLSAIASSLITVTGVVFSVTIVALQLASSQYTPRLLRDFTADRGNQLVLGVFIGTFTYTLLVLRTVRAAAEDGVAFVPAIAVTLAIVLAIVNIGFLIYFIDHSARSIQVSTILARITERTKDDIAKLFPEDIGTADPAEPSPAAQAASLPVKASRSGYLQKIDSRALFDAGREGNVLIVMETEVGGFVLEGEPLARISGATCSEETARRVRSAFVLGPQRTPGQDVEFGLIEISDIAVKALSPGINDPTTAVHCIHRLGELLVCLGTRSVPAPIRTRAGVVHFIARHPSFDDLARRAVSPIRHFGADAPMIVFALLTMLRSVSARVPAARKAAVAVMAADIVSAGRARLEHPSDRDRLEELAEAFHRGEVKL